MDEEKIENAWVVLCLVAAIAVAVVCTPPLCSELGWSRWILGPLVFLDIALMLHIPLTARAYYATARQLRGPSARTIGCNWCGLSVLTLTFVVAPPAGFMWLYSLLV